MADLNSLLALAAEDPVRLNTLIEDAPIARRPAPRPRTMGKGAVGQEPDPALGQHNLLPRAFMAIGGALADSYEAMGRMPTSWSEVVERFATMMPAGGLLGATRRARSLRPDPALPMDPESVAARQRQLGYSGERFWRGDEGVAGEYPGGGFFARDFDTATGHAVRRQGDPAALPREFRLAPDPRFLVGAPLTLEQGERIAAIVRAGNPRLAADILGVAGDGLPAGHILHALGGLHGGARDVLRRAGFASIDTGRGDILMLSGGGIRSADAAFDPRLARLHNIYYGGVPVAPGVGD